MVQTRKFSEFDITTELDVEVGLKDGQNAYGPSTSSISSATYITRSDETGVLPNSFSLGDLDPGALKISVVDNVATPEISAPLTSIDELTTAADKMIYTTAPDVYATSDLTAFARTLLDDADAAAARTTLDAQQELSGLAITPATVALDDKVLIQDTSAADVLSTVTVQSIIDEAPQGDVEGPGSSTVDALVRWDNTLGTLVADSTVLLTDAGVMSGATQIDIDSANGLDVNPGSDIDADLLSVGVTGTPQLTWDESQDGFKLSKGLMISAESELIKTISTINVSALEDVTTPEGNTWGGRSMSRFSDSAGNGNIDATYRARGTAAAPTIIQDDDTVYQTFWCAYDGVDYAPVAQMVVQIDGTPGSNDMPGRLIFRTTADSGISTTERLRIDSAGLFTFNSLVTLSAIGVLDALTQLNVDNLRLDGNAISSTDADGDVDISPNGVGEINLNSDIINIPESIFHTGDPNTAFTFGTDTISLTTGGTTRLDLSNSGMRLGSANARVTTIIDDDTMATASATNIATSESIKAYVDAQVSGSGFVVGPASATDTAIAIYDGITGELIKNTGVLISGTNVITGATQIDIDSVNGLDVNPGSDINADLVSVGVTGAPKLTWVEAQDGFRATKGVMVGTDSVLTHSIEGVSVASDLNIQAQDTNAWGGLSLMRASGSANRGAQIVSFRSKGTTGTPTIVADDDVLFTFRATGFDGTDYAQGGQLVFEVDGTPAAGDMPGRFIVRTSVGESLVERLRIDSTGMFSINSSVATFDTFLDEDSFASDDPNAICSQQSIKAYVDSQIGGTGILPTTEVTGTTQSMAVNNAYIANNAGLVTLTLPTTAAIGDMIKVRGKGAGGWRIDYTTDQQIIFGADSTTVSTGTLDSTQQYDCVTLTCITADDIWLVEASQGSPDTL